MVRRGAVVALEGVSGVGKSTIAARLARRLDAALLAEAYDRLEPGPSLAFADERALLRLERTLLREDARRYRDARVLAAAGRTVVADTGFLGTLSYTAGLAAVGRRSPATCRSLLATARSLAEAGSLGLPDLTVLLTAPVAAVERRAASDPRRHPARFRARHRAVAVYEERHVWPWLGRLVPVRKLPVRNDRGPDRAAERIARWAASVRPVRSPERRWVTALRAPGPLLPLEPSVTLKKGTPPARPPAR